MRIYIAGPMTGLPGFNYPAFNLVAHMLRARGHTVVNPADQQIEEGKDWRDYMLVNIPGLCSCDAIYLLKGWENSRGATLELFIATQLGMKVQHE